MYHVHDRQREGKAGNGKLAYILAEEHAVDYVVYRRHYLGDDGGECVTEEQFAYGFLFEFSDVVHFLSLYFLLWLS